MGFSIFGHKNLAGNAFLHRFQRLLRTDRLSSGRPELIQHHSQPPVSLVFLFSELEPGPAPNMLTWSDLAPNHRTYSLLGRLISSEDGLRPHSDILPLPQVAVKEELLAGLGRCRCSFGRLYRLGFYFYPAIARHAGTGRNEFTDNHIFLQT